jgi:prevent-host-death family protein
VRGDRVDALAAQLYGSSEMYKPRDEHETGHVSVSEARETFAELVNRAAYGDERVLIARRGRPVAAIVPIADVEFLERLEDELDLEAAREALADPENAIPIPWEQVKDELGL